jgi:hypothetical protein
MARQKLEVQYRGLLKQARALHDARYEVDHPKPRAAQQSQETGLEKAVGYLWIIWLILALAGAVISLPHTLGTVLSTLGIEALSIQDAGGLTYAVAVFVGVELALISVALVSELSRSEKGLEHSGKQASLAGLTNAIVQRIGLRPPFDLSHLPDRRPSTGVGLVALLFLASLTFNLVDALFADLPAQTTGIMAVLMSYQEEVLLLSRAMAGILGPALLLIAGHRFAQEVVRASTRRQRADTAQQKALEEWEAQRDLSWQETADAWITRLTATQQEAAQAVPLFQEVLQAAQNGNGHRVAQDY